MSVNQNEEEHERIIQSLRRDCCPDCSGFGFVGGPRGGAGQNIFCAQCGSGFNVAPPRFILFVQRITRAKRND